ncbi:MAG: hypothetical protein PHE55_07385 [Methylococcaceae bacterium]|nr:hypothetical protein [Methylococcaceae bacterium]
MIYVVEFPHQGPAHAWFAFEQQDFSRKTHAAKTRNGWTVYEAESARQLLEKTGTDSGEARSEPAWLFDLAERQGWDTVLYRADYLLGQGIYQTEPVSEFEACVAAITHDLSACRVYLSDAAAMNALYRDPLYDGREGFHAHMALREQLIALEVISDEL